MSVSTRRWAFCCLLLAITVLPSEVLLLRTMQQPTDKARAEAWAADLNETSRLAEAANIGSLPVTYQRALYKALPVERQPQLWLDRFARYQTTHPDLSAAQERCLNMTKAVLEAVLANRSRISPDDLRKIQNAAKGAFTESEAAVLFGSFSPGVGVTPTQPVLDRISSWIANHVLVHAGDWVNYACSCHVGGSGINICAAFSSEGHPASCEDTSIWCELEDGGPDSTGCGWMFNEACNGACWVE